VIKISYKQHVSAPLETKSPIFKDTGNCISKTTLIVAA